MQPYFGRDLSIDILRGVGLLAIFIAHTFTNTAILQLVSFDVTLLMLLSGASFAITIHKKGPIIWGQYFKMRFIRLVLPTWIFLAVYFLICLIFKVRIPKWHPIYCFTLCTEWYVWIIRVFIFIALLSPLIIFIDRRIKNNVVYVTLSILFFIVFDLLTRNCLVSFPDYDFVNQHFWEYLLYIILIGIPYVVIFAIGYRLSQMPRSQILIFSGVLMVIFVGLGIVLYNKNGLFIKSDDFKYPPHLYYVSFTLGFSLLLWCLKNNLSNVLERMLFIKRGIVFVGQNTIWIYLWHVLILSMTKNGIPELIRFLLVFCGGLSIYLIQYTVINKIVLPRIKNEQTKKTISRIFCG